MAAGTSATTVIGSSTVELSRYSRTGGIPFSVRISCRSNGLSTRNEQSGSPSAQTEAPSCLFVGPIDCASQQTLEALYRQARDAYYSGKPLIVDDMFDRVEVWFAILYSVSAFLLHLLEFRQTYLHREIHLQQLKLRWYGSKYVVKYPRCSLRRQSTYADAEEDPSQVMALASVWLLFLGIGSSACLVPVIYTIGHAYMDLLDSGFSSSSQASMLGSLAMLNGMLYMMLGSVIGFPVASASVKALRRLWKNDLVALKGACPNCGEEVFAFVRSSQFSSSPHRADCHVCECLLEFRITVEQSIFRAGKQWVHGRIYLIRKRGRNRRQISTL